MFSRPLLLALLGISWATVPARAQEPFEGETLISPKNSFDTFLIDMDGVTVMTWHGAHRPAANAYLLPDGSIVRPCEDPNAQFSSNGGRIQRIDANDVVVWDFLFSNYDHIQHHDIEPMPDGNVLLIALERKTMQEAIDAGRQDISGEMWPTLIVEIEPVGASGGNVVWEWHAWDHLIQDADSTKANYGVIADHPELIDINYGRVGAAHGGGDWIHANAIDYNAELDQIIFSTRKMNEFYVLDHSTTTSEAAGHTGGNSGMGGDILYRWGNPEVYGRGDSSDQYFHVCHGVNWIDPGLPGAGNILAFDNGDREGPLDDYSTVAEIIPPVDSSGTYFLAPDSAYGPPAPAWTYVDEDSFYAGPTHGGAYRLPNGNTLITEAQTGLVFEVTTDGTKVWEYDHPSLVPRARRYWYSATTVPSVGGSAREGTDELLVVHPNPFRGSAVLIFVPPEAGPWRVEILGVTGRRVAVLPSRHGKDGRFLATWDGRDSRGRSVPAGVYFARLEGEGLVVTRKVTRLK
jgi:hypothetical protein